MQSYAQYTRADLCGNNRGMGGECLLYNSFLYEWAGLYLACVHSAIWNYLLALLSFNILPPIHSPLLLSLLLSFLCPISLFLSIISMSSTCIQSPHSYPFTCLLRKQHETRALELLVTAFDRMRDRDFCILALPPSSTEIPLLSVLFNLCVFVCVENAFRHLDINLYIYIYIYGEIEKCINLSIHSPITVCYVYH